MILVNSPLVPIFAGFLAHRGFLIYGEWHNQGTVLVLIHLAWFTVLSTLPAIVADISTANALNIAIQWMVYYFSALYSSIFVYRIFFHRCCGFPGPILARSTKLWHTWKARKSQNHILLDELHHKYGEFVRTGPNEITVFDSQGFEATSGYGTKCFKSVWYDFMLPSYSVISARDRKLHDERRRVWRHAFTPKALNMLEPRVLEYVDKMDSIVQDAAVSGRSIDAVSLCHWFSFDVMGEFAFGKSFGMLDGGKYHEVILKLKRAFELLGPFSSVVWLARIGLTWLPTVWRMKDWNEMKSYCQVQMRKRIETEESKPDIASYLIPDAENNSFSEIDKKFLDGDAVTIITAGSGPTGSVLISCLYYLAKFPKHAEKLHHEVEDVDTRCAQALRGLPHLSAMINETMRLFPVVPTAGQRETPPAGITIKDRYIPGNTTVVVPRYTLGRSERYFRKADQFIPERWYSQPDLVIDASAHTPFGCGKSSCLGQSLALMNLKLVIALLVSKYHIEYAPGTDPEAMHTQMRDNFTLASGPLSLVFKCRAPHD